MTDRSVPTWENQMWHARKLLHERGIDALVNPHAMIGKTCGCGECFCCAAMEVSRDHPSRMPTGANWWKCHARPASGNGEMCGHVNRGHPNDFCTRCGCYKHASGLRRIKTGLPTDRERDAWTTPPTSR